MVLQKRKKQLSARGLCLCQHLFGFSQLLLSPQNKEPLLHPRVRTWQIYGLKFDCFTLLRLQMHLDQHLQCFAVLTHAQVLAERATIGICPFRLLPSGSILSLGFGVQDSGIPTGLTKSKHSYCIRCPNGRKSHL